MALEKIMPDDMNEVACAMLAYIGDEDRQAGAKMSYGDFGKHLAREHGRNYHRCSDSNGCTINGKSSKVQIVTSEGTEYELTWNKIAKFIHPYLKSTAVSETVETDTPTAAVNTPTDTTAFDYSAVDDDTAQYLRKATARIANSYADIGAVLAEAQERLANNKNGLFAKWYTSLGFKKDTVLGYIHIYNKRKEIISSEFPTIYLNPLEVFDALPKSLQLDISSPSAPAEAVNAVLSGDITTHKDYIAMKKRIEELEEELEDEKDTTLLIEDERTKFFKRSEELKAEKEKLLREYHKEIERANSERHNAKEQAAKCEALEAELRELRSRPVETVAIENDPKESQEYKDMLSDYNKMHRQVVATTQENDRLKDKQKELLQRYNELYEQARAAENDGRELTGYFLPVSVEEYSDICKQLKGTKYAELLYKAKLIKF